MNHIRAWMAQVNTYPGGAKTPVNFYETLDLASIDVGEPIRSVWNTYKVSTGSGDGVDVESLNNCRIDVNACCSGRCIDSSSGQLRCGGSGCGSLPGGSAECCPGTFNNNNPPPCDSRLLNAPCKLNCGQTVCCATTCINGSGDLVCGGSGCSNLPGGSANCCSGAILQSGVYCNGDPSRAPCILP
jgi:hypothetical protein